MELIEIKKEITNQLSDQSVAAALLATTFKGLTKPTMKRAIMEGMIRGFAFKDFLEKNVYAIPYGETYSLVTSIDHARKIGMRSGIVGKSAPTFEEKEGKIVSCTITVKRKVGEHIGDFTEVVVPLDEQARDAARVLSGAVSESITEGFLPAAPAKGACEYCDYLDVCGPARIC